MIAVMKEQKNRIHPHKFTLWVACKYSDDVCGLNQCIYCKTKSVQLDNFELPVIFWYSTAVIIISSITIIASRNAFRQREMTSTGVGL